METRLNRTTQDIEYALLVVPRPQGVELAHTNLKIIDVANLIRNVVFAVELTQFQARRYRARRNVAHAAMVHCFVAISQCFLRTDRLFATLMSMLMVNAWKIHSALAADDAPNFVSCRQFIRAAAGDADQSAQRFTSWRASGFCAAAVASAQRCWLQPSTFAGQSTEAQATLALQHLP